MWSPGRCSISLLKLGEISIVRKIPMKRDINNRQQMFGKSQTFNQQRYAPVEINFFGLFELKIVAIERDSVRDCGMRKELP